MIKYGFVTCTFSAVDFVHDFFQAFHELFNRELVERRKIQRVKMGFNPDEENLYQGSHLEQGRWKPCGIAPAQDQSLASEAGETLESEEDDSMFS